MKYTEIMKWFPQFTAKHDLASEYCKYIHFSDKFTAVTNGFCLIVDDYISNHKHSEDNHGNEHPYITEFEQNMRKTLDGFQEYNWCGLDAEKVKCCTKLLSGLTDDAIYLKIDDGLHILSADNNIQLSAVIHCECGTEPQGGVFSKSTILKILTMLNKTSPLDSVAISISHEQYPLLKIANIHTVVILSGLRIPPNHLLLKM